MKYILALDQGTTSSRAVLFDRGRQVGLVRVVVGQHRNPIRRIQLGRSFAVFLSGIAGAIEHPRANHAAVMGSGDSFQKDDVFIALAENTHLVGDHQANRTELELAGANHLGSHYDVGTVGDHFHL